VTDTLLEARAVCGAWSNRAVADDQADPRPGPEQLPAPEALLTAPGYVARRLHAAYTAAWQRYVDPVLTGPQFAVLTAVDAYPGVEQGSLARAVALDRSTMASIVKRLEDRELVTRVTPPEDGRKRLLYLTAAGASTLRAAYTKARELDRLLMKDVAKADEAALLSRLNGIAEQWESLVED
jgi:DNA-binding MarR family transcriptional regulator